MPRSPVRTPMTRAPSNSTDWPAKPMNRSMPVGLDLRRQPLHELVQRDDVVAVILERRRRDRQPQLSCRVSGSRRCRPCTSHASGAPLAAKSGIRSAQRRRVEQRARQRWAPASRALSITATVSGSPPCCRLQLRQPQRRRQPGRAAADDQHVDVEGLAFHAAACGAPLSLLPSSAISAGAISNRSPWMP